MLTDRPTDLPTDGHEERGFIRKLHFQKKLFPNFFLVSVRLEGVAEDVQNVTLICIHTQPSAANKEIDQLFVVQDTVR